MEKDKVKVSFWSVDFNVALNTIATREDAYRAIEDYEDVALEYIHIKGRINDYDNNEMAFTLRKSSIGAVEVIELNSAF